MKLTDVAFDEVKRGLKTIEIRLYDEKRRQLALNDIITFHKLSNPFETTRTQVTSLTYHKTYQEMIEATSLELFGPRWKSKEAILAAGSGYALDEQQRYGFLAIGIKLI